MKTVRLGLAILACVFAVFRADKCYPQDVEPVAYSIDEPIHIAGAHIAVRSVRIYGSQEGIENLLLRSSIISDCNCLLLPAAECRLSLLKITRIPADKAVPANTVRMEVPNSEDFIRLFSYFSREQEKTLSKLKLGRLAGENLRRKSDQAKSVRPGGESTLETPRPVIESGVACHREYKVCLSPKSASFIIGCEDIGEVEISTEGEVSVSLSVSKGKHAAARD